MRYGAARRARRSTSAVAKGWLVRALAAHGIQSIGVDVVSDLIDRATRAGGGDFRVASYEDIAAGALDVEVDAAVANFSLIGHESVDNLLAHIPRLLTRNGALIIQTLHPAIAVGDLPYIDGWRQGSWTGFSEDFSDPAPWYFRTIESWIRLLRKSGFDLRRATGAIASNIRQACIRHLCRRGDWIVRVTQGIAERTLTGDRWMMLSFVRRGVLGLVFAAAPQVMLAQATTGTVRGRVTDAGTGQAIANASVIVDGTRIGASTADNGAFTLSAVPTGARAITVRRIGYQPARKPVTVNAGDNAVGDIALNVSAVNLSEVVVTGTAAPTEKRKLGTSIASVDSRPDRTRASRDRRSGAAGQGAGRADHAELRRPGRRRYLGAAARNELVHLRI